jgi:hypothetical protein
MATGTTLSQQTVTGLALFGVGWLICVASFAFDPLACFEASDDDDGGCEGIGAYVHAALRRARCRTRWPVALVLRCQPRPHNVTPNGTQTRTTFRTARRRTT